MNKAHNFSTEQLRIKKQLGLSIIEIMISLVIGLILVAGISQIYLSNKHASKMQESVSYINNNLRYTLFFIQDIVTMAGYRGNVAVDLQEISATAFCEKFDLNQNIAKAKDNSDTGMFCVRMKAPVFTTNDIAQMRDCTGANIPDEYEVVTRMAIKNNQLTCRVEQYNKYGNLSATHSATLINDINLTPASDISFGLDDGTRNVQSTYINLNSMTSSDWVNVISLNVQLSLNSDVNSTGARLTSDGGSLSKTVNRTITLRKTV